MHHISTRFKLKLLPLMLPLKFYCLHKPGHRAFTLLEMLVVIAIIAVLALLALPAAQHMLAKGHTAKAVGNLRQIGVLMSSYTAENNNCLPLLLDWGGGWYPPWQALLSRSAGLREDTSTTLFFDDCFYDPAVKESRQHPYGGFGGNDAMIMDAASCQSAFGQRQGAPLTLIGPLSQKVIVASAADSAGSRFDSSWFFYGDRFVAQGSSLTVPKPAPRHSGKTLCLFADGHTEQLDTGNMTPEERRKYFQRDAN